MDLQFYGDLPTVTSLLLLWEDHSNKRLDVFPFNSQNKCLMTHNVLYDHKNVIIIIIFVDSLAF